MSILGLWEVVYDKVTGMWTIQDQVPRKPPAEPVYRVPPNLHDDPEAERADRARKSRDRRPRK